MNRRDMYPDEPQIRPGEDLESFGLRSAEYVNRLTFPRNDAGLGVFSTQDVAAQLGIDQSRVRRLAAKYNVGQKVGTTWVFTPGDVDLIKERRQKRGRPPKR